MNSSYDQNIKYNNRNFRGNYNQRNNQSQQKTFSTPKLVTIFNENTAKMIPPDAFNPAYIQDFIQQSNLTNSKLRNWYEGVLKIINTLKSHKQKNSKQLFDIELNVLKLIAKIEYDAKRQLKNHQLKHVQQTLIKTLIILQQLLQKEQEFDSDPNKLQDYIKQLETFWMLVIAYSKNKK